MPFILLLITILGSFSLAFSQNFFPPRNVRATLVQSDTGRHISLHWEKHPHDSLSTGFHIYVNIPPDTIPYLYAPAGIIYRQHYNYEINDLLAKKYIFRIRSVVNFPDFIQSDYSHPAELLVPSVRLPQITELTLTGNNEIQILKWNYKTNIPDLKCFRIKIDDRIVAELEKGPGGTFRWKLPADPGRTIRVAAVSYSGVTSKYSKPVFIENK